jgi:hypothetical protein
MKNCVLNLVSIIFVLGCFMLAGGCSEDCPTAPTPNGEDDETGLVPDFVLTDMNRVSSSYATTISPRDYINSVSAWYFGHAT